MTLLGVFVVYVTVIGAVVDTARVWVPVLLGTACLGVGLRWTRGRRRRRKGRPDRSGQDPDAVGDIALPLTRRGR